MNQKRFYIADFCCYEKRLIIEIDRGIHAKSRQLDYDKVREEKLVSMGFRIIRFTNQQVLEDWAEVAEILGRYL